MQGDLSYHEFKVFMTRVLQEEFEGDGRLNLSVVTKNNNLQLDAISWTRDDNNCSPVVYMNDLYEIYKTRGHLTQITDNVIRILRDHADDFAGGSLDWIYDFDRVREKLECRVVNLERNRDMLGDCPYVEILDLAVTFRVAIHSGADAVGSFQINNSLLRRWGKTVRELYVCCMENIKHNWEPMLVSMGEMLDMLIAANPELEKENLLSRGKTSEDMYVLTNKRQQDGAVLAFCTDTLKTFAGKCGCDLMILPSSIHEVLIIPVSDALCADELGRIVQDVNRECVSREEFLSDHVYRYLREKDCFEIEV